MSDYKQVFASKEKKVINSAETASRIKAVGAELVWIISGQAIAALGSIIGVRLLTGRLNPTIYGEVALCLTATSLIQLMILGPIGQGALRFYSAAVEASEIDAYLQAVLSLVLRATVVVLSIAGIVSIGLFYLQYGTLLRLVPLILIFTLISAYGSIIDGMQNAARQRAVVAWHQGLGIWLRIFFIVGLVDTIEASTNIVMAGHAVAALFVLGSQIYYFKRKIKIKLTDSRHSVSKAEIKRWVKTIWAYSWPFAAWGIFSWAYASSDRWVLQAIGKTQDVGMYAVLYQLGYNPIALISNLLVQLIAPVLYSRSGDGSNASRLKSAHRLNSILLLTSLCITVIGTVISYFSYGIIFSILVGFEYRSVSSFLPYMVLAGGLFASGQIATLSLMTGTESRVLIFPKIGSACVAVVLNIAGVYWFGFRGVVYAVVLSSIIYLIWILLITKRHFAHVASVAA